MRMTDDEVYAAIRAALNDEPKTEEEIAKIAGCGPKSTRIALVDLVYNGIANTLGNRPQKYFLAKSKNERDFLPESKVWKGTRMPYTRPGSYTPPEKPKVSMVSKVPIFNPHRNPYDFVDKKI